MIRSKNVLKIFSQASRGKGKLSEEDINLALREVRRALLEADVNYKVVKDVVEAIRARATGARGARLHHAVAAYFHDSLRRAYKDYGRRARAACDFAEAADGLHDGRAPGLR